MGANGPPPRDVDRMVSLKVDNISYRMTSDELMRYFDKYGRVGDIYIPRDPRTRESRGFAFVRYFSRRDAEDAMDRMDGKLLNGREIRVSMARYPRPPNSGGERERGGDRGGRRGRDRSRSRSRSRSRDNGRDNGRDKRSHSRSKSRSGTPPVKRRSFDGKKSVSRSKSRSHSGERAFDAGSKNGGSRSRSNSR